MTKTTASACHSLAGMLEAAATAGQRRFRTPKIPMHHPDFLVEFDYLILSLSFLLAYKYVLPRHAVNSPAFVADF